MFKTWVCVIAITLCVVIGNFFLKKATLGSTINYSYLAVMYCLWGFSIIPWVILTRSEGIALAVVLFQSVNAIVITLMGVIVFKEDLSIYQKLGVVTTVVGGIFLNIR